MSVASDFDALSAAYRADAQAFSRVYAADDATRRRTILTLAYAQHESELPLAMLSALRPALADALRHWTGRHWGELRKAQEARQAMSGCAVSDLEREFPELPVWEGEANHASGSSELFDQIRSERGICLQSFMSCCRPGFRYAYRMRPDSTLRFTRLRSARLVGALSVERCEGEVLLPRGARFRLHDIEAGPRILYLKEVP